MNVRRDSRSRTRARILSVEAGQVVCPRRGIVDIELCWACPAYDGWRFADGRGRGLSHRHDRLPGLPIGRRMNAQPSDTMDRAGDRPAYPGIPAIVDGSEAIAHVETRISEVACAYPITPSTTMAAIFQAAVAAGRPNLWGTRSRSSSRSPSTARRRPPRASRSRAGGRPTSPPARA